MPVTSAEFAKSQSKELPLLLNAGDCEGKTYVITGGYSGIGYETAKHLVELQAARVVLAVRDLKRGDEAKRTLEEAHGRTNVVHVYELDLSSFASVQKFAEKVARELNRVDGLVLNAALGLTAWSEDEGFETQLTVNSISNFLLTSLLFPYLQNTGKDFGILPRVVFIGSIATFLTPSDLIGDIGDDMLDSLSQRDKWESRIVDRYPQTKLLNHLAVRHLARVLPVSKGGVIVNVADPGLCRTGWTRNMSFGVRMMAWCMNWFVGRHPEMGSRSVIAALALGAESHGKLVSDAEIAEYKLHDWMLEDEGKKWEDRVWAAMAEQVERVKPGSVAWLHVD